MKANNQLENKPFFFPKCYRYLYEILTINATPEHNLNIYYFSGQTEVWFTDQNPLHASQSSQDNYYKYFKTPASTQNPSGGINCPWTYGWQSLVQIEHNAYTTHVTCRNLTQRPKTWRKNYLLRFMKYFVSVFVMSN
jgi:hypothetical protein